MVNNDTRNHLGRSVANLVSEGYFVLTGNLYVGYRLEPTKPRAIWIDTATAHDLLNEYGDRIEKKKR